jgi:hypothetical protein
MPKTGVKMSIACWLEDIPFMRIPVASSEGIPFTRIPRAKACTRTRGLLIRENARL